MLQESRNRDGKRRRKKETQICFLEPQGDGEYMVG
jgi:hypothetical protein